MTIQWFPGHMAKARRQITEKLKLIDVAIELLDARIPLSSRNPMIDDILGKKPRLILLNKYDLSDPAITDRWVDFFKSDHIQALPIDSLSGQQIHQILPQCKQLLAESIQRQLDKGMRPRAIRALIVGIPNVGKSTLINRLAGRKVAATGDQPGVTKAQQWIKAGTELELLDTPGVLWPKFEDPEVGLRLAITGAIKDTILHVEDIAFGALRMLLKRYGDNFQQRYDLEELPNDVEDADQIVSLMEAIGRRRGCLRSGGRIDLEKTSNVILRDLRTGQLGQISLEQP